MPKRKKITGDFRVVKMAIGIIVVNMETNGPCEEKALTRKVNGLAFDVSKIQ